MFDHEGRRAAEFATHRETLHEPREQNQDRRSKSNRRIRRHHGHREGADHHQRDGDCQRRLAALAVAIDAQHHGTERPHQERDAEGGDGQQCRQPFVVHREELLRDDGREVPVDEKVEPFQRIADGRREHDAPYHRFR